MVIKKNKKIKDINYYLNLPWTYTIATDRDEHGKHMFIIRVNELPGVVTDAPTIDEGIKALRQEVMPLVFELYMNDGEQIPEPINDFNYKASIPYKTTSTRQHFLEQQARKQNISLSQAIDACVDFVRIANKK